MDLETTSRLVLVTGCGSGFGRSMVTEFLRAGFRVIATLRHADARKDAFGDELARYGSALRIEELDVTSERDRDEIAALIDTEEEGRLDVLVNNAGYPLFGALEDLSPEQLRAQLEVNFFGVALLTRTLLPQLRKARGRVIQVSSVFGSHGFPLSSAYCASKFAVEGLTEALYHELAPHDVQVAIVAPGGHRTKFGEHIVWADRFFDRASAYAEQSSNYRNFQQRLAARRGAPADAVAKIVVKLARQSRMPLYTRVGRDAAFVHAMNAMLPERFSLGIFSAIYSRLIARRERALSREASS